MHLDHRRTAHFAHSTLRHTSALSSHTRHSRWRSCTATSGAKQCASINGSRYAICFVDDFSRHVAVYFLKKKSDAASALRQYIDEHSVPLQIRIRQIQSDAGGEFLGEWADLCRINGIRQRFSAPDLQAQNSLAERTWGTLVAATIRMLEDAQLPAVYFEDAMTTAAYIKNRAFHSSVDGMTPHEALWGGRETRPLSPACLGLARIRAYTTRQDSAPSARL